MVTTMNPADAATPHQVRESHCAAKTFGAAPQPVAEAILDHVQFGVLVVDANGRLVYLNRAARHECANGTSVCVADGNLVARTNSSGRAALNRAISTALAGRWSIVTLTDDLTAACLPLPSQGADEGPLAMVVFGTPRGGASVAAQLYARACRLTPTESRVMDGIAQGVRPSAIAARHNVALSTVRTQLGSIRSKTGARSIAELARSLSQLPPIMSAS